MKQHGETGATALSSTNDQVRSSLSQELASLRQQLEEKDKELQVALGNTASGDSGSQPMPRRDVVHDLKIWPFYFDAVVSGRKTFEYRKNDRDFKEGDTLLLREFVPVQNHYTGREVSRRITYIHDTYDMDGMVILALESAELALLKEENRPLKAEVDSAKAATYRGYLDWKSERARAESSDARLSEMREILEALVIDANRLCDRNLGGTYEEDCRRSIAKAREALTGQAEV